MSKTVNFITRVMSRKRSNTSRGFCKKSTDNVNIYISNYLSTLCFNLGEFISCVWDTYILCNYYFGYYRFSSFKIFDDYNLR